MWDILCRQKMSQTYLTDNNPEHKYKIIRSLVFNFDKWIVKMEQI